MEMFEVGGCVRDEILGIRSKDIDFTVVLEGQFVDPFRYMVDSLRMSGFSIYVETPEFLTVRAKFPKNHTLYPGKDADFVLARKESNYTDGRRPDLVEVGTLYDDLKRRDFTMNAIAKMGAVIIDPHYGVQDIKNKIIRAVGDPLERLSEDPLRALRALRFSVTKGFNLDRDLRWALTKPEVVDGVANVSDERIADELSKMFRFDSVLSIVTLNVYPTLMAAAFSGKVSLDSTLKTKGRG